ncbi:hypothetical protein AGMMS49982_15130 [Bacteroidia bacterium]|nr:hypothetical protein AGMMS49982_15130 [Bacteroidia bacterium]
MQDRGLRVIAAVLGVLLSMASCETHYLDEGSGGVRYPHPEAVLTNVGVCWTDPADVSSLERLMRAAAYAPAGGEGWVNPGTVNPVVPDENFLKIYQAAWNAFQWQIEPRPYVYDKGSNSALRDYKHDGVKSVYDAWEYDVSGKWQISSGHDAESLVLALDRYWADTLDNANGWVHQDGGAGIFRSDRDKIRWKSASSARMRRVAYVALYKQVEKAYYDLKLFVEAYGMTGHPIAQTLLTEMGSYIKSNVDALPSQNSIKVDHSVWDHADIPRLLSAPYNDSLRFGNFNTQTAMLTNVVMEQQQQNPTTPASPSRVAASRGKLFEFFFGCLDVDGQYIPFGPGEGGFPVFTSSIAPITPATSLGVTWGDPQPSLEWKARVRNMTERQFIDTIKTAIANWALFEKSIDPRPYYRAPGSTSPSPATNAYEVFSRASTSSTSWFLDYRGVGDTIIIKRYWSNDISTSAPSQKFVWLNSVGSRQVAFKKMVTTIQSWMSQLQASALWNLEDAGTYPLRQLYAKMAAFIAFPSTDAMLTDRPEYSYKVSSIGSLSASADLPSGKSSTLFEYYFGVVLMPLRDPETDLRLYDKDGTELNSSSVIWLRNNGETQSIFADVTPPSATNGTVTWSMSSDGIGFVNITPVGSASAPWTSQEVSLTGLQRIKTRTPVTITATTYSGLSASCKVMVLDLFPVFDFIIDRPSPPTSSWLPGLDIIYTWGDIKPSITWASSPAVVTDQEFLDTIAASLHRRGDFETLIEPRPYYDPLPSGFNDKPKFDVIRSDTLTLIGNIIIHRYWPATGTPPPISNAEWYASLDMRRDAFTAMADSVYVWVGQMSASPLYTDPGLVGIAFTAMRKRLVDWVIYPTYPFQNTDLVDRMNFDFSAVPGDPKQVVITNTSSGTLYEYYFGYLGQ